MGTTGGLIAAVFVSVLGLAICAYGRNQRRPPQFVAGVLLMVYPYFVSGLFAMLAVGAVVILLLWLALRAGW